MRQLAQYHKKFDADYANLDKEYNTKYDLLWKSIRDREKASSYGIPDGEKCKAYNDLANQYLPKYAMLMEDWQKKNLLHYNKYFDELIYWGYLNLHPDSEDYFRDFFYTEVAYYLEMLVTVGRTKIIEPYCDFTPTIATIDSNAIKEMDCPLNIEIPFGFGNAELNCEKFSIKAGEGAVFGYEKNFKTHQSTVSVGIGLILELEAKVGPLKAGVSAEATETAFITLDGDNKFSDGGLKNEAKVSAGATGVGKKEVSVGSTLGIHSGYNFDIPALLKEAPEVPLNKNVKIYKPK